MECNYCGKTADSLEIDLYDHDYDTVGSSFAYETPSPEYICECGHRTLANHDVEDEVFFE